LLKRAETIKECACELSTVEAQEEPTYLNIGSILEH
jgi:hypothetical protein